jgi:hypothetical protein
MRQRDFAIYILQAKLAKLPLNAAAQHVEVLATYTS